MTPFNVLIHEKRVEKGLSVKTDPIYFYSDEYNAFVDAVFKKIDEEFSFTVEDACYGICYGLSFCCSYVAFIAYYLTVYEELFRLILQIYVFLMNIFG